MVRISSTGIVLPLASTMVLEFFIFGVEPLYSSSRLHSSTPVQFFEAAAAAVSRAKVVLC
jgi:hypothetical protein